MRRSVATATLMLMAIGPGATVGAGAAGAAGRTAHHGHPAAHLAQSGHGAFGQCPAKTTTLLIAVNRLQLHPGQTLVMHFVARNLGTSACTYTGPMGGTSSTAATSLEMGPCGSLAYEVLGAHHRNVWPGHAAFGCPALGYAHLQPGGTASGSGQWNQILPSGSRLRPGPYTLVVDSRFVFGLRVEKH